MAAARSLRNPLKAATFETLIGLLAVTGMFSRGQSGHFYRSLGCCWRAGRLADGAVRQVLCTCGAGCVSCAGPRG
jgi:hypothetical protein